MPIGSSIRQDGEIVAEHPRSFGRGRIVYDPWHCVPILTEKPGALRNGAPFKGWQLPNALGRLRTRPSARDGGGRQFAKVPAAVLEDGLEAARAGALDSGACSAGAVPNILGPAVPAGAAGGHPGARGPAASPPAGGRLSALRPPEGAGHGAS